MIIRYILFGLIFLLMVVIVSSDLLAVHTDGIYEKLTKDIQVYGIVERVVVCDIKNESCKQDYIIPERSVVGYRKETYDGKKIGTKVGNKKYFGENNLEGDILSTWKFPQGDRDYDKFGRCRDFEIEKGVCEELKVR